MKLNQTQVNTIINALYVAAERYMQNAAELRAEGRKAETVQEREVYYRLAKQFDKQAGEARTVAAHVENEQE